MPGGDVDPATGEADHLMKEADLNKVCLHSKGIMKLIFVPLSS